jgi:hypothetical protein
MEAHFSERETHPNFQRKWPKELKKHQEQNKSAQKKSQNSKTTKLCYRR